MRFRKLKLAILKSLIRWYGVQMMMLNCERENNKDLSEEKGGDKGENVKTAVM